MGFFDLSFQQLALRISAPFKRGANLTLWYKDILSPLQTTHDDIFNVQAPLLEDLTKYNSQTLVLEDILNTTYGVVVSPFIYIQNNTSIVDQLVFRKVVEGYAPTYFRHEAYVPDTPIYFRNSTEAITEFDFVVFVPVALFPTIEDQVRALVEDLKIVGVNYDVQSY
jgi:hypothetical protein